MRLVLSVGLLLFALGCDQNRPTAPRPAQSQGTAPEKAELQDAIRRGLITATARGAGLSQAVIEVKRKGTNPLTVEVSATTLLGSKKAGVQNMVVTKSATIDLNSAEPQFLTVAVACVNMPDKAPQGEELIIQPLPTKGRSHKWADLRTLLSAPAFQELDSVSQQFAVWTITDDPTSVERYVSISTAPTRPGMPSFGQGPDPDRIKAVFVKAGIDPTRYAIFRPSQISPELARERARKLAQMRVEEANTISRLAKEGVIRRADALKRAPTAAELTEIKPLEEAGAAIGVAEDRFSKATQTREKTEASAYAEAKAKDGLEDRAWEAMERQVAPLAKAEAEARTEAAAKYRLWMKLATMWVRSSHIPKDEADKLVLTWESLADNP